MRNLIRQAAAPVLIGAAVAAGAIACQGHPATQQHITVQQSQMAKADAKALTAKCIPASATDQLKLASSLKTKAGRTAFEATCGIPPAHKQAFEAQLLNSLEQGHLSTSTGRATFFSVT